MGKLFQCVLLIMRSNDARRGIFNLGKLWSTDGSAVPDVQSCNHVKK